MTRSRSLLTLQFILLGIGMGCIGYVSGVYLGSKWVHWRYGRVMLSYADPSSPLAPGAAGAAKAALDPGDLVGRLRIDRIGLTAIVLEGADRGTLRLSAGHLPESPLPGDAGRVALAGHRDGSFRPLKDLRPGDQIVLETSWGDYHYGVDSLRIVEPTDVGVLSSSGKRELLLLTCYPFSYLGRAPRRFAVLATQMDLPAMAPEAPIMSSISR